jgi:hypothetical protein
MLSRWAPRWILLNSGKVMGLMPPRLGNSGLAGNVKNILGKCLRGGRGNGPARAGKLGGGVAFALCARVCGDRFQCLLRPVPAAAWGSGFERRWAFPMQAFDGSVSGCPLSFHRWVAG